MKKREFLKTAGLISSGLVLGAGTSALLKRNENGKNKKIIAINGSPNENGNTAYALSVMEEILQQQNIDFQIIHVGKSNIRGCIACYSCRRDKENRSGCLYTSDEEKQWISEMESADAIILASPTFFGGIAGTMKSFLDKAFFSASQNFKYKIGASVVTTRRTGASIAFMSLNQYFTISEMPIASSTYWNNMRGLTIDDLKQDSEGVRILQNLAKNIAKLLKG